METEKQLISHLYQNKENGKWIIQTNDEHQRGVAEMATSYSGLFGLPSWGHTLGMLHDKGKERDAFQQYIRTTSGLPVTDEKSYGEHHHAFVGGILVTNLMGKSVFNLLANQIISHHTGLHDYIDAESVIEKRQLPEEINKGDIALNIPQLRENEEVREKAKLATENWDYPIIVTTNVQLFESMFSNKPSDCRKLHNIVNSVLILDEAQTLPTDFLQPIVDALKAYQKIFGVSVLFTTASQPVLSGLIEGTNPKANFQGIDHITEIIPNEFALHDKLRRVKLVIDNTGKTYDEIAAKVAIYNKVLCIVNTRKDAKELYDRLPNEGIKLHLSRMMCPAHISETIRKVKALLKDKSHPIVRVIATQLVEAGVDIDFPVVFRQESGLDSILQAAGRCNREGRNTVGTTFVFSLAAEKRIPFGAMKAANNARLNLPANSDWFDPSTMTEYFYQLYCRKNTFDDKDMKHYLYNPNELCFETASKKFRLIDDDCMNIIVNWENSMELVEKLKESGCTYPLMKQLAKFTVGVHSSDFDKLVSYGAIEEVLEGIYVLTDRVQYDKNTGLSLDNHWMEELLMI